MGNLYISVMVSPSPALFAFHSYEDPMVRDAEAVSSPWGESGLREDYLMEKEEAR